jgi:hypothetical protein
MGKYYLMFVFILKIIGCLILVMFTKLFKIKYFSPKLYYAILSLSDLTYRMPEVSKKDHLIVIRIYKKLYFELFKKKDCIELLNTNSNSVIFDGSKNSRDLRINYIEKLTKDTPSAIIWKAELLCYLNIYLTFFYIFLLTVTILPVFLVSLFQKNKYHFALFIEEFIECIQLRFLLYKNRLNKVHYFCIFERDANLCAFLLMNSGIYINKIPSEVPLHFFNQKIIANELSICFPYQKEEVAYFKKSIFIEKLTSWVPEQFFEAPKRFLLFDKQIKKSEFQIGFFSSGNWLREIIGDVDLGFNDSANEQLLFKTLIDYSVMNNIKIQIFLHPLEKKEQYNKVVFDYYKKFIDDKIVFLADKNIKSIEGFDTIEIGVAMYSTLMFERLVLGFKTIIAPWDYIGFPIPNSSFSNICSKSRDDIIELIEKNINLTTDDFFRQNHIEDIVYQP